MLMVKNPKADLRFQYRKTLELSTIGALLVSIFLFHGLPGFKLASQEIKSMDIQISVEEIPPTEQIKKPPPPARPAVPIPSDSEEIPEDLTIESTDLDLTELPPPPPPPGDDTEEYRFISYDVPPEPIGGYGGILANLQYPEIARKAGLEAKVVVGVLIDRQGNGVKSQVLSSTNSMMGFDEAAQQAVMAVKWKPARQRDLPVKVWVSIPIRFSIDSEQNQT